MKNSMSRSMAGRFIRTRHAVITLCLQYTYVCFSIMLKSQLNYELQYGFTLYTHAFPKTNEQGHWSSLSIHLYIQVYKYIYKYTSIYLLGSVSKLILSFSIVLICFSARQWAKSFTVLFYSVLVYRVFWGSLRWLFFSLVSQWDILL